MRIPILGVAIRNFLSQVNRGFCAYRVFLNFNIICQTFPIIKKPRNIYLRKIQKNIVEISFF